MPGVIGAIYSCHIRVHPPVLHQKNFLNYKRFHSIVLMAIVKADRHFSYISVGFPGSNHDSYVLQRSCWWSQVTADPDTMFGNSDFHIVGDSAFPMREFLLIPYRSAPNNTKLMKTFNLKLSSTRVNLIVVEQTFGDLQNRFRRCLNIEGSIENAVDSVVASCCIHNAAIACGYFCPIGENVVQEIVYDNMDIALEANAPLNAIEKRERLARIMI